ncbi:hypothetical protein [Paenibacillus kyungheensis]
MTLKKGLGKSILAVTFALGLTATSGLSSTALAAESSCATYSDGHHMYLKGVVTSVLDANTGKKLNNTQWAYYKCSGDGEIAVAEGSPEFKAQVGRYYTGASITKVVQGNLKGVNVVTVYVKSSQERTTTSTTIPGYKFYQPSQG